LNTWFLDAIVLKLSRNSDSESGLVHLPMSMVVVLRMSVGTVASTSASIESKPMYLAISASSAFVAELWRRSKLLRTSIIGVIRQSRRGGGVKIGRHL
jgi:hypothetical protein